MTYKQIKWLILCIPTVTIGIWEYVRHTVLLPYISMELGNWLAPVFVLLVTLTLMRSLFRLMEDTQDALQRERLLKAELEEREQLAHELHDGIAQSLFMLSVKLDRLESAGGSGEQQGVFRSIRGTVRRMHDDVRQSIAGLRSTPTDKVSDISWTLSLRALADDIRNNGGPSVSLDWRLPDGSLSGKEKVELLAILREALINAHKHADAGHVHVTAREAGNRGFRCRVEDNGRGATGAELDEEGRFGIRMMRSRAQSMCWLLDVRMRTEGGLIVEVVKGGDAA